jgi:hypothetical protein
LSRNEDDFPLAYVGGEVIFKIEILEKSDVRRERFDRVGKLKISPERVSQDAEVEIESDFQNIEVRDEVRIKVTGGQNDFQLRAHARPQLRNPNIHQVLSVFAIFGLRLRLRRSLLHFFRRINRHSSRENKKHENACNSANN